MYAYPELLETQENFSGDIYQDFANPLDDISLSDIPKYKEADYIEIMPPVKLPPEKLDIEDTSDGTRVTFNDGAIKEALESVTTTNEDKTKKILMIAGAGLLLYLLLKK